MMTASNRRRIRNLADVARLRLRFVNRERGSGHAVAVRRIARQPAPPTFGNRRLRPRRVHSHGDGGDRAGRDGRRRVRHRSCGAGAPAGIRRGGHRALLPRVPPQCARASPLIRWWQRRAVIPSAARSRAWADTTAMPRETGCTSPTFSADGSRTEARPLPRKADAPAQTQARSPAARERRSGRMYTPCP